MHYLRFVVLGLLFIVGADASARAESISQGDFLDRLKQSHPLFEKEELSARIEQQRRDGYLGTQDWKVQSSVFFSHDEPSYAIAGPEKTDAVSFTGGLEKSVWSTGGRFSATFSSGYANLTIDPLYGLPDSYFENRLAVAYVHPLLRNKGGALDRLAYDLSKFDVDLSKIVALENEEVFLARSADRFLDWVLLVEQQRIVVERLHLSEAELKRTRDKRAANLIDEVDVIRAEDAVRVARQNLLLIESRSRAVQSELAVLLQEDSFEDMIPEYDLYQTSTLPTLRETTERIRENSRLLRALSLRIDQQEMARSGFAEQGRADLSLIAQAGLKNAETDYGKSLAMDVPEVRIGLQLGFPVGNRTARADIERTSLFTMQLQKQYDEVLLELSSAAANLHTQAMQLEAVLQLNREQIQSAEKKTEEELKLYNQGRGELTFVIQSRDSEQAARLTYAANAISYHKLLLQLLELSDQLYR